MKQTLLIEIEVEVERGDDALNTAKEALFDDWDRPRYVGGRPVQLRAARFLAEHAR